MNDEQKPNKIRLKILLGAFYLFVFFILLFNSFSYLDPDFGWHLKTGEQIWQTHAVPSLNNEDYTLSGTSWVDHEWLMNLITYLIYHNFGYVVLSIFFALIILAVLLIQLWFARKFILADDRGLVLFLALQFFGLYASRPHLGVRMQEITILCLQILLIIIFIFNRNKNYRILFWLPLLFIFWASAHAGFLIGFAVLTLFVLVKAVEWFVAQKKLWPDFIKSNQALSLRAIGIFTVFSGLSALATLATPYGWRLYQFLFSYRDNFFQTHISEWQSQLFYPFIYPQLFYIEIVFLFFALCFFAVFVFKNVRRQRIDLWNLALLVIFTLLALKARRHFPLLFIVSLPIMAGFFIDFFSLLPARAAAVKIKNPAIKKLPAIFLVLVLLLSGAYVAVRTDFTNRPEQFYRNYYPAGAVEFLRAHPEWNNRRIFNDYSWGGYLIWQYPERKIFIDGRLPQYPLHGSTMLEEYFSFSDREKLAAKLSEYDIGLVLVRTREEKIKIKWWERMFFGVKKEDLFQAQKDGFALRDYLRNSPAWQSVYDDGLAEVFVKK